MGRRVVRSNRCPIKSESVDKLFADHCHQIRTKSKQKKEVLRKTLLDSALRRTSMASVGHLSSLLDLGFGPQRQIPHRKKLNPFFFSWAAGTVGWPQTALVICRIAREISESACMSEIAVFCIRRTAT